MNPVLSPVTAALLAEYATSWATGATAAPEDIWTTCPELVSNIVGTNAWSIYKIKIFHQAIGNR